MADNIPIAENNATGGKWRWLMPFFALTGFALIDSVLFPKAISESSTKVHVGQRPRDRNWLEAKSSQGLTAKTAGRPANSWKDIVWRLVGNFSTHRILAVAAGTTFYILLAIFPAMAALVSVYGFFAEPSQVYDHLNQLSGLLPSGAIDIVGEQVTRIASKPHGTLGVGIIVSLGAAIWSANAGMKAIFDALNAVHGEPEKRGFFKLNAISLAFTLAATFVLVLILFALVALPIAFAYVGLPAVTELLLAWGRWPLLLLLVASAIALLYRFGPCRREGRWRSIVAASAFSAVVWLGSSALFSWYVANFGTFNATYGSLGAAIGFLTWIWLSTAVVLVGAELNVELENRAG